MPSSCVVVFNEHPDGIYSSGQILSGTLMLTTNTVKAVRGIYIKIHGYADVQWTEEETKAGAESQADTDSVTYSAKEKYFTSQIECLSKNGNSFDLLPGTHSFHFQIQLPDPLPSSFSGKFGEIRYEIVCTIDRPWRFNNVFKHPFTIISAVDLNSNPMYRQPAQRTTTKHYSAVCCCGDGGRVLLKGYIPYNGFAPGQSIPVKLFVQNLSDNGCHEVKIKLTKMIEYRSHKPRSKSKYDLVYLTTHKFGSLKVSEEKELKCNLNIPSTAPSSLSLCKIIEITYFVEVQMKMKGLYSNMCERLPITIGTVPLYFGATTPYNNVIMTQPLSLEAGINERSLPGLLIAAPPSYEEAMRDGPIYRSNAEENKHIKDIEFIPKYPVYHYSPEAIIAPSSAHGETSSRRLNIPSEES